MLRTIYGFDDLGRKVPAGSYDDGINPVGGPIFYIDPNSDEVVAFYDSNFNEISNVTVGDTPAYYKMTSAGVSGKEKYYVYDNTTGLVDDIRWGYYNIATGTSDQSVGAGKTNTSIILGIEDTSAYSDYNIWTVLRSNNSNKVGGCDDWYVGSMDELTELRSSNLVTDWWSSASMIYSSNEYLEDGFIGKYYHLNSNPPSNWGVGQGNERLTVCYFRSF